MFKPEDYTGSKDFVYLHNHTVYSTLDGVSTPEQYADRCYELGWPAMAATEHGNMASVPDMFFAFSKYGLRNIPGCEIYFNDYEPERKKFPKGTMNKLRLEDPDYYSRVIRNRHLTLLAKNETGYHNLLKLTTQAYETGYYRKPRVWFDKLCEFKEGIIVLSGCMNGPVSHELRLEKPRLNSKDKRGAVDWIHKFSEAFGEDYYIEIQMSGIELDHEIFWQLSALADHFKINKVISNDCHYFNRMDFDVQTVMMATDQGLTVDDPNLFHVNSSEQYMKTRAELWASFKNGRYCEHVSEKDFEEACDNTLRIAEICEKVVLDSNPKLPVWDNEEDALVELIRERLREKGLDKSDRRYLVDGREVTHMEQAGIELQRIIEKGFASYFLVTADIIRWGRDQGWPFSPRGSAGGSLVNYLLGISPIDPLKWKLSFDRFLSPARGGFMLKTGMPDPIDDGGCC